MSETTSDQEKVMPTLIMESRRLPKRAQRIFGYSSKEILNKHFNKLLIENDKYDTLLDSFRTFNITVEGIAIGKVFELEGIRKNGTRFPLELSISTVREKGKLNNVGIIRDITERKRVEKELRRFGDIDYES